MTLKTLPKKIEDFNEDYLIELDKKHTVLRRILISVCIVLFSAFIGQWLLSYQTIEKNTKDIDKIKSNLEEITASLKFISKDYVPYWYLQGMNDLYALNTERIIAVVAGKDKAEIQRIENEFKQTIQIMQDNFIRMRGGMDNITRNYQPPQ